MQADAAVRARDVDVRGDRVDDVLDRAEVAQADAVEALRGLLLERVQERLLAGVAVEVGVGVAEAREGKRVLPRQELIARQDVDHRPALALRQGVVLGLGVDVGLVDRDVDTDGFHSE